MMRSLLFICLTACSGTGIAVVGTDDPPIEKPALARDAAIADTTMPDTGLVSDAGPETPDSSCVAPSVSYDVGTYCGPMGAGQVCQAQGTIYVCREDSGMPMRPLPAECVLVSRTPGVTRTLCPTLEWVASEDPGHICSSSFPNRFNGPATGLLTGCVIVGGWSLDGVTGRSACCP